MYMMHGFGGFFIGLLFVISAVAVVLDMRKYSDEVWKRADEPKNVWYVVGTAAGWPFGLLVYLFVVRPKLEALYGEDNHEALKQRMFAEWEAEQERKAAGGATAAPVGEAAPTTVISESDPKTA